MKSLYLIPLLLIFLTGCVTKEHYKYKTNIYDGQITSTEFKFSKCSTWQGCDRHNVVNTTEGLKYYSIDSGGKTYIQNSNDDSVYYVDSSSNAYVEEVRGNNIYYIDNSSNTYVQESAGSNVYYLESSY